MGYRPTNYLDITLDATILDRGDVIPGQINPETWLLTDPDRFEIIVTGRPNLPMIIWSVKGAEGHRLIVPFTEGENHIYRFIYIPGQKNEIDIDGLPAVAGQAPTELVPTHGNLEFNVPVRIINAAAWQGSWDIKQPFPWVKTVGIVTLLAGVVLVAKKRRK